MKLAEINKAVTAAATALAGMEGVVAFLNADTTHPWVHVIAVGFSAVVGAATWVVKNKDEIAHYVDEIDGDETPAAATPLPAQTQPATSPGAVVEDVVQAAIEQYKNSH